MHRAQSEQSALSGWINSILTFHRSIQIDLICYASSNAILPSKIWTVRVLFIHVDDHDQLNDEANHKLRSTSSKWIYWLHCVIWNSCCGRQNMSNDSISFNWYESLFTFIADVYWRFYSWTNATDWCGNFCCRETWSWVDACSWNNKGCHHWTDLWNRISAQANLTASLYL